MQSGDSENIWFSLLIKSIQLYSVSDELGIYSNQFQIIGAMVAAIGNQLGVISSEYSLEGDRLQLLAVLYEAEDEFEESFEKGEGQAKKINQLEKQMLHQIELMNNRQQSKTEQLRQQMAELHRQVEQLRQLLEQHIKDS